MTVTVHRPNILAAVEADKYVMSGEDLDEILNILDENEELEEQFEQAVADVSTQSLKCRKSCLFSF